MLGRNHPADASRFVKAEKLRIAKVVIRSSPRDHALVGTKLLPPHAWSGSTGIDGS